MASRCQAKSSTGIRCVGTGFHRSHIGEGYAWEGNGGEPDLTGTGALAARGYTHRQAPNAPAGRHDIIDTQGNVVASLKPLEVWDWLRDVEPPLVRGIPNDTKTKEK